MFDRLRIFTFCTAAILIFSIGCKRQEQSPAPIKPGDKYQLVDPYKDLIACLDGPHHTLYVLPEQRESVLKLLHASGSGDRYILEAATNVHRKAVPCGFVVKEASLNMLLNVSGYFELARTWIPSYNDAANRDTARGKLLDTMTRDGIFYRVYLDAQCMKISDGHYTDCEGQVSVAELMDTTGKPIHWKNVRRRFYPINHCVKGTGSCVEALSVSQITEYYSTNNCSGAPVRIEETSYDFSCP
jgi:hypothetical protein